MRKLKIQRTYRHQVSHFLDISREEFKIFLSEANSDPRSEVVTLSINAR